MSDDQIQFEAGDAELDEDTDGLKADKPELALIPCL